MKNKKPNYKVSVYLVDDKTSYRLRFYYKQAKRFLPQRFKVDSYDAALQKRDKEQANEKWMNYEEENRETKNDFIAFFEKVIQGKAHKGTRFVYNNALSLFKHFKGDGALPFNKVNKELIQDFREFLLRTKKQNTASCRFALFLHGVNQAFNDNLIERFKVERIPQKIVKKDVLTEEDINTIIKTEWLNRYKEIFLFECLTTVSFDDMKRLKWKQIEKKTIKINNKIETVHKLSFIRGKTGNEVNMILSEDIIKMIGKRKGDEDYIFLELTRHDKFNDNIKQFIMKAGINKHITSHCGRATGIIRVTEREGIYAAAKQAGHAKIDTTLRYAQYTDKMMIGAKDALMSGINFNPTA